MLVLLLLQVVHKRLGACRLRVVPPVVAVAEEGEDADHQAHHHKQGQGHQEKPSTERNPRATPNEQDEELLHPPGDTKKAYWFKLIRRHDDR